MILLASFAPVAIRAFPPALPALDVGACPWCGDVVAIRPGAALAADPFVDEAGQVIGTRSGPHSCTQALVAYGIWPPPPDA